MEAPDAPYVMYVKGAPDLLLERCSRVRSGTDHCPVQRRGTPRRRAGSCRAFLAGAARHRGGLPLAAVHPARTCPPRTWRQTSRSSASSGCATLRGPRPRRPCETARRAGIRVVMVTGDDAQTAAAIGRTVGLLGAGGTVLTGTEIDALDDASLSAALGRRHGLCPGHPAAQGAHRGGAAARGPRGGHDG